MSLPGRLGLDMSTTHLPPHSIKVIHIVSPWATTPVAAAAADPL